VGCLSFFLLLPTTVTLCLLFVPKVRGIHALVHKRVHDSSVKQFSVRKKDGDW